MGAVTVIFTEAFLSVSVHGFPEKSNESVLFVPYFDKLFLSYEMKCMKPDRAIFDRMAAEAPLVPAETLFIDDSAANAAAGAALGYRTFCPRSNSDWREEVRRILGAGV